MTVNTRQHIHQLISQITAQLHLVYISDDETTGKVCFANQSGLRPEYRQSFTHTDLLDYLYAMLQKPGEQQAQTLHCPADTEAFWQSVQTGHRLREINATGSAEVYQQIDAYLKCGV